MPREFVVRILHNGTDDRWTYSIDGVKSDDMLFPQRFGGKDDFGFPQAGKWNENSVGFLNNICCFIEKEIEHLYKDEDSFEYPD